MKKTTTTTIVLFMLLTGCVELQNKLQDLPARDYLQSCEAYAKKLIPSAITLETTTGRNPGRYGNLQTWLDGSEMKTCGSINFYPGSAEGQNVNYLYQQEYFCMQKPAGYTYAKKIVDKTGVVLGSFSFGVNFVVKPLPNTARATTHGYTNQDFEVISATIDSCTKPAGVNLDDYVLIKCVGTCMKNAVIECGTDENCFEEAEKECRLARLKKEKDGQSIQFEVEGISGDTCVETVAALTPGGTVAEQTKITCKIPRNLWGGELDSDNVCTYCTGGKCR